MTGPKPRRSVNAPARTRSSRKAIEAGSHHLLKALGDGSGRAAVLSILGGHSGRVDLAARDELGRTALHLAAARGDCVVVGHLLEAGADAEAKAADGLTALYSAAMTGHVDVVRRLLEAGAKAEVKASNGWTALLVASRDGYLKVVDALLSSGRCGDLEARDRHGWTALYGAAWRGHASVVRRLLEAGANADVKASNGSTALLAALCTCRFDVVDVLLTSSRFEDLEARDKHGRTALHYVAAWGHASLVRRLLEVGADAEVSDRLGDSVLEAARSSVRPIIQAAVDAGPARRMANLRWHRAGRRHLVMWRRAALACAIPEA